MTVGERIKARRKELGMNAESLAEKLGCAPSTIYRYESGSIEKVDSEKLIPIAEALATSPAALMGWTDDIHMMAYANTKKEPGIIRVHLFCRRNLARILCSFVIPGENSSISNASRRLRYVSSRSARYSAYRGQFP